MSDCRILAEVRGVDGLDGLMEAARARILELGVSCATVDALAGWADGYTSKLLSAKPRPRTADYRPAARGLGSLSLPTLLGTLGLKLLVATDDEALERVRRSQHFVPRGTGGPPMRKPMLAAAKHKTVIHSITLERLRELSKKGGASRKKKLPNWKRVAIARKAARARWRVKAAVKLEDA